MPTCDDLAELYSRPYFERGKYGQDLAAKREQKRRLAWMLACGIAPGARVLDAGCAVGEGIKAAKSRYEMWGIDISAHAIELARANNPELKDRLRAVTVEEADFTSGFFRRRGHVGCDRTPMGPP